MIQAETPVPVQPDPSKVTVTKVHGFSSPVNPQQPQEEIHPNHNNTYTEVFYKWWHKIALVLLTVHALIGLWESIKFIVIEYPELDHLLSLHLITEEEINQLLAGAVIILFTTTINIILAIRLSKVKEDTAHNIDLIVATIVILGTTYIQRYLNSLDLLNLIQSSL